MPQSVETRSLDHGRGIAKSVAGYATTCDDAGSWRRRKTRLNPGTEKGHQVHPKSAKRPENTTLSTQYFRGCKLQVSIRLEPPQRQNPPLTLNLRLDSSLLQSKHIQQPNPSLKFFLTSARPDSHPSTQLHRTQDRHLLDPPSMTGPATISSRSKSNPRFDQRPSRAPPKLLGLLCCVKCRSTGNRSGNPLIRIVQFQV